MLPGSYEGLNGPGPRNTLGDVTFGVWNEDAYQLYMDMMTLKLLVDQVDPESLRADCIAGALEQATLLSDFEQPLEKRIESYRAAREALRPGRPRSWRKPVSGQCAAPAPLLRGRT